MATWLLVSSCHRATSSQEVDLVGTDAAEIERPVAAPPRVADAVVRTVTFEPVPPLTEALRNDLVACVDEIDRAPRRHYDAIYEVSVSIGDSGEAVVGLDDGREPGECFLTFGGNLLWEWNRLDAGPRPIGLGVTYWIEGPRPGWKVRIE